MDNVILDVVLGLLLIYLVLALLAMKVQEYLVGDLMRRRAGNAHDLVAEAVGNDDAVRAGVMANPLIFALSESKELKRGLFPRGPSAIPPELFARALLIHLNGNTHPSESFPTPQAFMQSRERESKSVWQSLRALLPGADGTWTAFEGAIARWFREIGERSTGWWQRESQRWALVVAFLLAAVLNVDTMFVAERLAEDPSLRRSLASLAEQVNSVFGPDVQKDAEPKGGAANTPVMQRRPAVRAAEHIGNATANISEAFRSDPAVAGFGFDRFTVEKTCGTTVANIGEERKGATALAKRHVSNADVWLNLLPKLRTDIGNAAVDASARTTLEDAYKCLGHIAAWVGSATTASDNLSTRKLMVNATLELDQARGAVLELVEQAPNPATLKRMYLRDPEAFEDCVTVPGTTRSQAEACMLKAQNGRVWLPIGHSSEIHRLRFCRVAKQKDSVTSGMFSACDVPAFEGNPALGISQMQLTGRGSEFWAVLVWLGGLATTALFVALGAPFWFDVLSRVSKVRAAGRMLDEPERQKVPDPIIGSTPAVNSKSTAQDSSSASLGLNDFERALLDREVVAVQQALPGVTATGVLDAASRAAIERKSRDLGLPPTNELSLTLYERITGRTPSALPALRESDRPQRGTPHRLAAPLATKLMTLLDFPGRLTNQETAFGDDLRALAVLYRYKTDPTTLKQARKVFHLADNKPAVLDEIDDALVSEILARPDAPVLAREAPTPWLDWAIGELGQVERNRSSRESSDPRICEYLDAVGTSWGDQGDTTAWCGAFVAWVVTRYNAERQRKGLPTLKAPPPSAITALAWKTWGTNQAAAALDKGHVVVVKTNAAGTTHHVGFCFAVDAQHVWLLGGNQSAGTRVSLSRFARTDVQHIQAG